MNMFGYTYLTEKHRLNRINIALKDLAKIPEWHLRVAHAVYPEAKGRDLQRHASEYKLFVEDIARTKDHVNSVLKRRFAETVEKLAEIASKAGMPGAEQLSGLGGVMMNPNPYFRGWVYF